MIGLNDKVYVCSVVPPFSQFPPSPLHTTLSFNEHYPAVLMGYQIKILVFTFQERADWISIIKMVVLVPQQFEKPKKKSPELQTQTLLGIYKQGKLIYKCNMHMLKYLTDYICMNIY